MKSQSIYLSNESPLLLYSSAAIALGVSGALVAQQIIYWINNPHIGKVIDGQRWVKNSVRQWREDNFPFWSEKTITRTLDKLCEDGILLSSNKLNANPWDRTYWYTIDFERLDESIRTKCPDGSGQLVEIEEDNQTNSYTETTTETTTDNPDPAGSDCLPEPKTPGRKYRVDPKQMAGLSHPELPKTDPKAEAKAEPLTSLELYLGNVYGKPIAGFTEQRAKLKKPVGEYDSPEAMWEKGGKFRQWVAERMVYYKTQREAGKGSINLLINLVCKYDGDFGWLKWSDKNVPFSTRSTAPQELEPEMIELIREVEENRRKRLEREANNL